MRLPSSAFTMAVVTMLGVVHAGFDMDVEIEKRDMEIEFSAPLAVRASGSNLQTFTGSLGGATADPITLNPSDPTHPFLVKGVPAPDLSTAWQHSCANQHNACTEIANASGDGINNVAASSSGGGNGGGGGSGGGKNKAKGNKSARATAGLTTGECDAQQSSCLAAQSSATQTASQVLRSQDANFDYFCDS